MSAFFDRWRTSTHPLPAGVYAGSLVPTSPQQLQRNALRAEAAALRSHKRQLAAAEPSFVADLVLEYAGAGLKRLGPGAGLTLLVEDMLDALGIDRPMRALRPGLYEAIAIAALVGRGFIKGTRGKAVVYRLRAPALFAEQPQRVNPAAGRPSLPPADSQQLAPPVEGNVEAAICAFLLEEDQKARQGHDAPLQQVTLHDLLNRLGYADDGQLEATKRKAAKALRMLGWKLKRSSAPGRPWFYARPPERPRGPAACASQTSAMDYEPEARTRRAHAERALRASATRGHDSDGSPGT